MSEGASLEQCVASGGVAVFPADTVYGLACDPENTAAVARLYALKCRDLGKPSAIMFFSLEAALATLGELGARTRSALARLMPGGVTVVLPNLERRFALACGEDAVSLGVRVPDVPRLADMGRPVLQSSANHAGGPDARSLAEVPDEIRAAADLVIDGGELPGTPSTVIDLRAYETSGEWTVLRVGAVSETEVAEALA